MKLAIRFCIIITLTVTQFGCGLQQKVVFKPRERYHSHSLVITQITANTFIHTSFKQTNDFGYVPCNGLVVRNQKEALVFDTPTNDSSAQELIAWITDTLQCHINAIIPTHFHDDCLGGLSAFHKQLIPSYAHAKTIALATKNNMPIPQHGFTDSLVLKVGEELIIANFLGEGHTQDNIIGYFPSEQVMFGGCLVKEKGAGKGYLRDANIKAWSGTVKRVIKQYPTVKVVVPGHGKFGNKELLEYTAKLFAQQP